MFQGRYGSDQLNRVLGITAVCIALASMFLHYDSPVRYAFSALSTVCIVVVVLRMFSRNFSARSRENAQFASWWVPFSAKVRGLFSGGVRAARTSPTFAERRKFKYFICPQCAQRLRVPRGKGKLRVTCTRCGNKFEIKS